MNVLAARRSGGGNKGGEWGRGAGLLPDQNLQQVFGSLNVSDQ